MPSTPDASGVPVFARAAFHTVFDNALLDYVLPTVTPSAWKVLCLIVRHTVGFQREATPADWRGLSYPSLKRLSGIKATSTIQRAVAELCDAERKGGPLVLADAPEDGTPDAKTYRLNRAARAFPPSPDGVDKGGVPKIGRGGGGPEIGRGGVPEIGTLENKVPRKTKKKKNAGAKAQDVDKPGEAEPDQGGEAKRGRGDNGVSSGTEPPTPAEVRAYFDGRPGAGATVRDLDANAQAFFDRHAAAGWTWKGEPIRDWRVLADGWIRRRRAPKPRATPNTGEGAGGDPGGTGEAPGVPGVRDGYAGRVVYTKGEADAMLAGHPLGDIVGFGDVFERVAQGGGGHAWAVRIDSALAFGRPGVRS